MKWFKLKDDPEVSSELERLRGEALESASELKDVRERQLRIAERLSILKAQADLASAQKRRRTTT